MRILIYVCEARIDVEVELVMVLALLVRQLVFGGIHFLATRGQRREFWADSAINQIYSVVCEYLWPIRLIGPAVLSELQASPPAFKASMHLHSGIRDIDRPPFL